MICGAVDPDDRDVVCALPKGHDGTHQSAPLRICGCDRPRDPRPAACLAAFRVSRSERPRRGEACSCFCHRLAEGVTVAGMAKPNPIQAVASTAGFRLIRPGARYAVHSDGDARPGAWLPDGDATPDGWTDVYPENEARALLPFLRARGTGGRPGGAPTTADGRLVAHACKRLGLSAAGLAEKIGAHESVLSRARNGELPAVHREAIRALLRPGAGKAT